MDRLPDVIPQPDNGYTPSYSYEPASSFTAEELAGIYNQTRVDYIVPMPMNAKRMQTYVRTYDVDLDSSAVVFDTDQQVAAVGMLGARDQRAWITRLGVIPERRGRHIANFMMESLINAAKARSSKLIQLEVIVGNDPAHRLFHKFGFRETRQLVIIRRPPGHPANPPAANTVVTPLREDEIWASLAQRNDGVSWVTETASLMKLDNLKGLRVKLPSGYTGWVVYQSTTFEISYVITYMPAPVREEMLYALLYSLHELHPTQDTKIENIPQDDLHWSVYHKLGYLEMFRRWEMVLHL